MKNTKIIGAVVIIIIAIAAVFFFTRGSNKQQVSKLDATDTVRGFYEQWLKAVREPNTDPNQETLAKSPILSKELRVRLASGLKEDANIDPVLCQTVIPENISTRTVYDNEKGVQILVTSQDKKVTEQAIFTLIRHNEGLYIDDIQCSLGEFAPEREFSFERQGHLLKDSIPAPYNSKDWHLVFEENNQLGHVAPLFFDNESQCTDSEGSKSVCKPELFVEATKVYVRGQMSELGVSVKQLEIVK